MHILSYFVVLLLLCSGCLALTCRAKGADVESWLILTTPEARIQPKIGNNAGVYGHRIAIREKEASDYTPFEIVRAADQDLAVAQIEKVFRDHMARQADPNTLQFFVQDQPEDEQKRGEEKSDASSDDEYFNKAARQNKSGKTDKKFHTKNKYLEAIGYIALANSGYYVKASHSKVSHSKASHNVANYILIVDCELRH